MSFRWYLKFARNEWKRDEEEEWKAHYILTKRSEQLIVESPLASKVKAGNLTFITGGKRIEPLFKMKDKRLSGFVHMSSSLGLHRSALASRFLLRSMRII